MVGPSQERLPSDSRDRVVVAHLLEWFRQNRRPLPFRRTRDPYAIWVSEVMLQQTQVKTALPYFERWMDRFPTVEALARATEADVLSAWQGLGYYSRGRNLHRTAQVLMEGHRGKLPRSAAELIKLPGIGRYTAGAIASIAYDEPVASVDGNVIRVLTRLDARTGDPRKKPLAERLWTRAEQLVRLGSPRLVNQGLMELGALVCLPTKPLCALCPLISECLAQRRRLTERLPELAKRPTVERRQVTVYLARRRKQVLLLQQPASAAHWAGLFTLPFVEPAIQSPRAFLSQLHPKARLLSKRAVTTFSYPITRFRFQAQVFAVAVPDPPVAGYYVGPDDLSALALPAPHRRLLAELNYCDS